MSTEMKTNDLDDMLPEYDFSGGVRGKYAARYHDQDDTITLDPDLKQAFPTEESVNFALRVLKEEMDVPDELSAEVDFSKMKRIDADIAGQFRKLNLVSLDADVKAVFPDSQAVNEALRLLIKAGREAQSQKEELSKAS